MTLNELLSRTSLKAIGRRIDRHQTEFLLPSMEMVEVCRADDFDFFQPFINAGKLTVEQMHHAAARYHLGKTKSGLPMFWMIDDTLDPLDAHIGNDTWLFQLLKKREPLLENWPIYHCLFGLHLLKAEVGCKRDEVGCKRDDVGGRKAGGNSSVCIVESERSAVVLSELFPESLWMAYATEPHLQIELFQPLEGRTVTIYPRSDPYMSNYLFFDDLAASVRRQYPSINISVSAILEDNATDDQKSRCIDLLDFIFKSLTEMF